MRTPKVSVVMIFLDSMRFIEEALASLCAQTFTDWELLLVDDGSSDGSSSVARRFVAAQPGRARYFEHPGHANRGTSASRNLALAASTGEYLIRLDSDDVFHSPGALAEQVGLLDANPDAAFVYGALEYWSSWDGKRADRIEVPSMAGRLVAPPDLLASMLQSGANEPVSMMVRRQVLLDIGGCDERIRDYGEDFALAVNLTSRYGALVSPACWYRYRMHPDSYTHRIRSTGELVRRERELMTWLGQWLRAEGIVDRRVIDAFRSRRAASAHRPLSAWWRRRRADAGWCWLRGMLWFRGLMRGHQRGRVLLVVDPPVVRCVSLDAAFVVQLRWSVADQVPVQVRVGAPDGPLLCATPGPGSCCTGDWASDRMCFFLQQANHPRRDAAVATLAIARVRVKLWTNGQQAEVDSQARDALGKSHATEQTDVPGP